MLSLLLSGRRKRPMIGLARSLSTGELVLSPRDVRGVVGPGPRIYYFPGEELLCGLREVLGRGLALPAGAARVWWPGLSAGSDPSEHPLIVELDGEPVRDLLGEFARRFDLSRPRVRLAMRVSEDVCRLTEAQLARAVEDSRGMKIERDKAVKRARAGRGEPRDSHPAVTRAGRARRSRVIMSATVLRLAEFERVRRLSRRATEYPCPPAFGRDGLPSGPRSVDRMSGTMPAERASGSRTARRGPATVVAWL
jgi:hypothetical protein